MDLNGGKEVGLQMVLILNGTEIQKPNHLITVQMTAILSKKPTQIAFWFKLKKTLFVSKFYNKFLTFSYFLSSFAQKKKNYLAF